MIIINAENKILGRLATFAAKKALLGEEVAIVNSNKAIITGNKASIFKHYKRKFDLGTHKGPIIHRSSDKIVKRTIRGMLPYKQAKGAEAYKRIKCYIGLPKEFEGKELVDLKDADISRMNNLKYVAVETVSKFLGGKL
jgi:large subunit ribosomal protein L13